MEAKIKREVKCEVKFKIKFLKQVKNKKGFASAQFVFAFVIAAVMITILCGFAFTFAVVEITQYTAFATARTYASAQYSKEDQLRSAVAKYKSIKEGKVFTNLFSNGWFNLPAEPPIGDFGKEYQEDTSRSSSIPFIGARLPLGITIFRTRYMVVGESGTDEDGFSVFVTAFISREPTQKECEDYHSQANRFQQGIKKMDSRFEAGPISIIDTKYVAMEDNGC